MSDMKTVVDDYFHTKTEFDALSKHLEALKKKIKSFSVSEMEGNVAIVTISVSTRQTLVSEKVKKFLTDNELAECTKETEVETIRVKAKDDTSNPF
jgi:hypothetical protein